MNFAEAAAQPAMLDLKIDKINPQFSILLAVVLIRCTSLTMVARKASIDNGSCGYHTNTPITSLGQYCSE
jgi:hypothetical protein